jgi:hypothetical protein
LLRRIVLNPWFCLADLLLVALSGAIWVSIPEFGIWFTLIALLPWGLRLLAKEPPFQRTPFNWLMAIFLITAWVGYWAAYDKTSAWIKIWLIVTAVLLYFALSAQPKQNYEVLSLFSFYLGLAISIYFFLTHDFTGDPGSLASWWINHKPRVGWRAIHHGYTSGLIVIANLFALYWLWNTRQKTLSRFTIASKVFLVSGLVIVLWAFVLTVSRGILAATACGLGTWILWRTITSNRFTTPPIMRSLFPLFVLVYLCAIIVLVYLGPARAGGDSRPGEYGENTRAELFERGTYFLLDFPITGSGLNSFPGQYSQYMIVIPHFYFINSYNMFLDVAIEQGLIGGLALILIYLGSIWLVSRLIVYTQSQQMRFFSWLCLFALIFSIVHGLSYDYLYNGNGTLLLLFPVGISMIGIIDLNKSRDKIIQLPKILSILSKINNNMIIVPVLVIIAILTLNLNKITSIWYSNLGAVQMSQVELKNFPTNQWATAEIVPQLEMADISLRFALQSDPGNQTANYRLGLISMLRQDFESAVVNLESAYEEASNHRGIIKTLGYCYVWLGEMDKAQALLEQIPEAQEELKVYVWWWGTQGRSDLSAKASLVIPKLELMDTQP